MLCKKKYNQCITPAHMVAYLAYPKYKGEKLASAEEKLALECLKNIDDGYVILCKSQIMIITQNRCFFQMLLMY